MNEFTTLTVLIILLTGCNFTNKKKEFMSAEHKLNFKPEPKTDFTTFSACGDKKCTDSKHPEIACTLTSPELMARKATVIASLKRQVLESKELPDGFAYRFHGDDAVVDELTDFIKTERQCCSFFTFDLSVKGDKSVAWLKLTGPEGAKEFITTELDL